MNGNSVFEVGLAGAHFYSDGEALDNFVRALADDVETNNSFFRTLYDELEGCRLLFVFFYHAEVERPKGSFVCAQVSVSMVVGREGDDVQVLTESPYLFRASGSVRPTVPTGG